MGRLPRLRDGIPELEHELLSASLVIRLGNNLKILLRDLSIDRIPILRRLQEVTWYLCRHLVFLSPLTHGIEVATLVASVEIDICLGIFGVEPDLAENANVDGTHELLADYVEAVGWIGVGDSVWATCFG